MLKRLSALLGFLAMPVLISAQDGTKNPVPPAPAEQDSPLAEGWPGATMPGKIEVKSYPAYRAAIAKADSAQAKRGVDSVLFFPLFRHIQQNGIAMTTPVVNNYDPKMMEDPDARGEITMEFVYRTPTMGETGKGVGAVEVVDRPAQTYVCYGVQGMMSYDIMTSGNEKLEDWLKQNADQWAVDGKPRRIGYHGPMTPVAKRLWEIQIPIKKLDADQEKSK